MAAETRAWNLQADFEKSPNGARSKYLKLLPQMHFDMGALLHRVECCYLDIDQMTPAKDITVERCVNVLMGSIAKIKAKGTNKKNLENTYSQIVEAEEKLSKHLSEVHTLYFQ